MVLEGDVLTHLIDVEHEASLLILEAQKESDKRLAAARAKADSDFSEKFCKIQEELAAQKTASENKIIEDYKNTFEKYKKDLESIPQDVQALNKALENYFFNSNA